jgi:xylulokinase
MTRSLVAGVDCSTQTTKVVVVDAHSGQVVAEGRAPHTVGGDAGARETAPEVWWRALHQALARTERAGEVGAISVAGQQHGLVLLDREGRSVRPAMLWNDTRSAADAAEMRAALGGPEGWAGRVGVVPVASFTVAKWAWVRRMEPDKARAAREVMLPHDYLTRCLTGRAATDRGDASGTGWWSTATEDYLPEILDLPQVRLEPDLLPLVLGPLDPAGEVISGAGSDLGLRPGIPVGPGTGDNMGAAVGLGLSPGVPVVSLGTSGTAYAVSTIRTADPTGTVAGFADAGGLFLPLAATLNCTLAVDRFASWLGLDRDDAADSTDVVVLPYLDGERTPNLPRAAGTITGLRHETSAQQILLAAYEGAAASLLGAVDLIDHHGSGIAPGAPLILIGGGARGRTWQRIVGRLSGRPMLVPEAQELVALGAAVQAAAILTGGGLAEVAGAWGTQAGKTIEPIPRDDSAIERIRNVRARSRELMEG